MSFWDLSNKYNDEERQAASYRDESSVSEGSRQRQNQLAQTRLSQLKKWGKRFLIGGGLMLGAMYACDDDVQAPPKEAPETQESEVVQYASKSGSDKGTSRLKGHLLTGYRAQYAGMEPGVFDADSSSFEESLEESWREKRATASNQHAVDHIIEEQVQTYERSQSQKLSLDAYLDQLESEFRQTQRSTRWDTIQTDFELDSTETRAVRGALDNVSGETLGAYMMTELLPQTPGRRRYSAKKNEAVLDYALRNGGTEFLEGQPANNDAYASFGVFQNSSFVVRNDKEVTAAANIVNEALPEDRRVPGSMMYLDDEEHVYAAYGVLTAQLSRLVEEGDSAVERRVARASPEDMAKLAAGLHHNPQDTWSAVGTWSESQTGLQPSWFSGTEEYVKQTQINYDQLRSDARLQPKTIDRHFDRSHQNPCGDEFHYFKVSGPLTDESPRKVAETFDHLDGRTGDEYEQSGNLNVVGPSCDLFDKGEMYFRARPH